MTCRFAYCMSHCGLQVIPIKLKITSAVKSISSCFFSVGYFEVHLCPTWTTQAPLMHKINRNTGVKQVCTGGPQHLHSRNGEIEPRKGVSSFLQSLLYLVACYWTVNASVQLGESRLRPGTLPLWGSSRGSLQGIRGDPVYQPSSRVQKESRPAMRLSPVTYLKCTVRTNVFDKAFALSLVIDCRFAWLSVFRFVYWVSGINTDSTMCPKWPQISDSYFIFCFSLSWNWGV